MVKTIKEALHLLDPNDDSLWTGDGLPRMKAVERLIGDKTITRKDVIDAEPGFCCRVAAEDKVAELAGLAAAELEADELADGGDEVAADECGHIFQGQCQLHKDVLPPCNCSQRS